VSRDTHYFRVGLFVLGGLALAVATIVVVGGGRLFSRPTMMETVFDESVQGLDVGSPVKLRGVKLGTVQWIGFVRDAYDVSGAPDPMKEGARVLVRMEIVGREGRGIGEERLRSLKHDVAKGLRLRLTPLGITGAYFIQADYLDPAKNPPMEIHFKPQYFYVPSVPSTISQISNAAEQLMSRIDKLDVEGLLTHLDTLLVTVNAAVQKTDVGGMQRSLSDLLADARHTSAEARRAIAQARVEDVSADVRNAVAELTQTLARLDALLDGGGEDLGAALENLRVATQNLRDVTETARAYPSYLLFGSAPPAASPAPPPPAPGPSAPAGPGAAR
jgi:paraquat-inducible protein B